MRTRIKPAAQAAALSLTGLILFGALLFWPASTFNYWQAWVFMAVFAIQSVIFTVYLGVKRPEVLRRRLRGGPVAETRTVQKIVALAVYLWFGAMLVVSVLDHRFGWSSVPPAVSLAGNVLVVIGLGITMLVVIQNSYAAATVTIESDQKLVSTGLYGIVRHPMYVGALIMAVGVPLALGSYWGLVAAAPGVLVVAVRILDEEKMLRQELAGYADYSREVHYRLVPYVW
jgi:protein-S-isoprenylcysteine O-methyltransferase Ste14